MQIKFNNINFKNEINLPKDIDKINENISIICKKNPAVACKLPMAQCDPANRLNVVLRQRDFCASRKYVRGVTRHAQRSLAHAPATLAPGMRATSRQPPPGSR